MKTRLDEYGKNIDCWEQTKHEIYADRQHHICKNCDDFAVCANMIEGSDTPCEEFEWFPEALYVLTAQQYFKKLPAGR